MALVPTRPQQPLPWWQDQFKFLRPGYLNPNMPLQGENNMEYGTRAGLINAFGGLNRMTGQGSGGVVGPAGAGAWLADQLGKAIRFGVAPAQAAPIPGPQPTPTQPRGTPTPVAKPVQQREATTPSGFVFAFNRVPGDAQTSGFRDPQHNKDVGGVRGSYHTQRDSAGNPMASDRVPPRGMSMPAFASELTRLNPTLDVINEGDHVHLEPRPGQARGGPNVLAFNQAAQASGLGAPPPRPDMGGLQRADQLLQGVGDAAMQPFSGQYTPQELPPLPVPTPEAAPDFSVGDAAFQAAQPKNPFGETPELQAKEQLRMRRASYFAGIGQALASTRDGEGLGALFARMGGGALMGTAHGDAEVRDRMEKFDNAMQGYQMAMANREDGKAQHFAQIANRNISSMNDYAKSQWQVQVREIEKFQPKMEDGVLITFDKNPTSGEVTETHTPMDPSRRSASAYARANIAQAAGNMVNDYSNLTYRHSQALAAATLPYAMADATANGNYGDRNGILGVGMFDAANALVETGQWENLVSKLGPQTAATMKADAYKAAGLQMNPKTGVALTPPNEAQLKQINDYLVSTLVPVLVNNGKAHWLIGGKVQDKPGGPTRESQPEEETVSAVQAFRSRDRRLTVNRNAKGQTSYSESYDGN